VGLDVKRHSLRDGKALSLDIPFHKAWKPDPLGRSVLSPDVRTGARGSVISTDHKVHLLGYTLLVAGFPWMNQHVDISVCAHVACWSILRHYSERWHRHREYLTHDITMMAQQFDPGGLIPSKGLQVSHAERVFQVAGTYPVHVAREDVHPEYSDNAPATYERQIRMFGRVGQARLAKAHVVIIGLGGIGSLVTEYLARLGVGRFTLVDGDLVEESNLSRIVGATHRDAEKRSAKVAVAKNLILQANTLASVKVLADDVAKESIAKQLVDADYIFLAADSMRARLVFNALVHQYLIPGVQLGSKIRCDPDNLALLDIMSANRPVRPDRGCLWCNQFIDPSILAIESKSDEERKAQAYGVAEPNPSVISLNAVSAAHAVNDFLLDYLALKEAGNRNQLRAFSFSR
jgi:hypothetical protein